MFFDLCLSCALSGVHLLDCLLQKLYRRGRCDKVTIKKLPFKSSFMSVSWFTPQFLDSKLDLAPVSKSSFYKDSWYKSRKSCTVHGEPYNFFIYKLWFCYYICLCQRRSAHTRSMGCGWSWWREPCAVCHRLFTLSQPQFGCCHHLLFRWRGNGFYDALKPSADVLRDERKALRRFTNSVYSPLASVMTSFL